MGFWSLEEEVASWRSYLRVVRVSAIPVTVLPCCPQAVCARVHWYRGRTVPCVSAVGECVGCVTPARSLVFLGVRALEGGRGSEVVSRPGILEVPMAAWVGAESRIRACGGLLSSRCTVGRVGGKRGRVEFGCVERASAASEVVLEESQILAAVCRLWGVPDRRLGELDTDWLTRVGAAIMCDGHYRKGRV